LSSYILSNCLHIPSSEHSGQTGIDSEPSSITMNLRVSAPQIVQCVFGLGIGNSNWAFGTTSEPGGGQRNKVWVQTTNTLRFKDNGYGARTYQLTILSNTN